ncbi:MAG: hypothetical protein OXH09_20350 [Gammaproteobacteria bacterium]|nr:hypothetical protein [Gammaproteobacteria bacterium]
MLVDMGCGGRRAVGPDDVILDAPRELSVVNFAPYNVWDLRIWPSTDQDQGANRLVAYDSILSEEQHLTEVIDSDEVCEYNVEVAFDGGGIREFQGVDVCTNPRLVLSPDPRAETAGGTGTTFSVANRSDRDIGYVYVSANEAVWGEDRLGDEILHPDTLLRIEVATHRHGCRQNIMVQFGVFGNYRIYRDVDVCSEEFLVVERDL